MRDACIVGWLKTNTTLLVVRSSRSLHTHPVSLSKELLAPMGLIDVPLTGEGK